MRFCSSGVSLPCSLIDSRMVSAAILEFAEIFQFLLYVADLYLVQVAGGFLPIAGDEGYGSALVQQPDGGHQAFERNVQLLGYMKGKTKVESALS